jgi:hypothetical protein
MTDEIIRWIDMDEKDVPVMDTCPTPHVWKELEGGNMIMRCDTCHIIMTYRKDLAVKISRDK